MQCSIDPAIDFAFEHIDELLFVFFGMRPRRTRARRQALDVDSGRVKFSVSDSKVLVFS
jgi:hypothetical protein